MELASYSHCAAWMYQTAQSLMQVDKHTSEQGIRWRLYFTAQIHPFVSPPDSRENIFWTLVDEEQNLQAGHEYKGVIKEFEWTKTATLLAGACVFC